MKRLCWLLLGEDEQIIVKCPSRTQRTFVISGALLFITLFISFIGYYQLFNILFANLFIASSLSLFLTLLFLNVYRLCLVTLTSKMRNFSFGYASSLFIRLTFILLMGLIHSKGFELFFWNQLFHWDNLKYGFILNSVHSLHTDIPITWILTFSILLLTVLPFLVKFRLGAGTKYYLYKQHLRDTLIINEYQNFKKIYAEIFLNNYQITITVQEKYSDPPFNTKPILENKIWGSHEDFLKLLSPDKTD